MKEEKLKKNKFLKSVSFSKSPRKSNSPRSPRSPRKSNSPRSPRSPRKSNSPRSPRSPRKSNSPRSPRSPRKSKVPEKVNDKKLWKKAKKIADEKYDKPSAYKSGFITKKYKELGGTFNDSSEKKSNKKKSNEEGLTRWFDEKWRNQKGEIGYSSDDDIYRPTKRINEKTPTTISELSKKDILKARKEKKETGKVKRFGVTKK